MALYGYPSVRPSGVNNSCARHNELAVKNILITFIAMCMRSRRRVEYKKTLPVLVSELLPFDSFFRDPCNSVTVWNKKKKKVREKSRECHNHKPQPFPDPKRKRKPTNPNKHKPNKRTKSTKISSLFPKRGNRNTKGLKNTKTK